MSLRISTNIGALTAHRYLQQSDEQLTNAVGKLSSGFRINSAADDPAGLVISESFRATASGLGQALSNTQHATNMVKTAEGAMQEINNLLRTMRDLAVHAANVGVNDSDAVAADQAQIDKMMESIDRIATTTQFGAKMLLDGSGSLQGSVTGGTGTASNVRVSDDATAGSYTITVDQAARKASLVGAGVASATVAAGDLVLNGVTIAITLNETAANIAAGINAKESESGVHATQSGGTLTLTQTHYGAAYSIDTAGSTVALDNTGLNLTGGAATAGLDVTAHTNDNATVVTGTGATWTSAAGYASYGLTLDITSAAASTVAVTVSGEALTFQLGAFAGQTKALNLPNMQTSTLFTSTPDVTTGAGAQSALAAIDAAISAVSSARADLGAFQKGTLESNANSLNVAQENIIASESTIRDADMASEMVNFTKSQILMQAGTAMIAQANQAPQYILQMLK